MRKGVSKARNNGKRRRENKAVLRVLRHPKKREQLINDLINEEAGRSPMRDMER